MIELEGVRFSYADQRLALESVDVAFEAGLTMLVGRNGCGKSTLLKVAAGVERPDDGQVLIHGTDPWKEEVKARQGLAYVPEQPDLTPYATVAEIVGLVARLRGQPQQAGERALESVGLGDLHRRSVRELSLGERRRAVLAAAMVGPVTTALLDEPLVAMDRNGREGVLAWIDGLAEAGATVVVVSHDIEPFVPRADAVVGLAGGRVLHAGPLEGTEAERLALLERLARSTA